MRNDRLTAQSRQTLDKRYAELRPVRRFAPPVRGWIKAIREALGMTSLQLARRLGMSQPGLALIEKSEAKGTIELATLRRVAEALDCTLVYALVPNKPLETMVQEQARKLARRRLNAVEHTMLLENQQSKPADLESQIASHIIDKNLRTLWDNK